MVTTLAGVAHVVGSADGVGSAARFSTPSNLKVDSSGKLFVADTNNHTIRTGIPMLKVAGLVSRKTHGSAGTFDVDLPLSDSRGIECHYGGASGNHTLVVSFSNKVGGGNAVVESGIGSVVGSPSFSERTMTINLTGITNAETVTIKLTAVMDNFAQVLPDNVLSANFLVADTTGNGTVNSSDVSQIKLNSGQSIGPTNFRLDITADGQINSSDIGLAKTRSGNGLP